MNRFLSIVAALLIALPVLAQQAPDADYTAQIKQFTTGPQFTTELVDHLPASPFRRR